MNLRYIFLLFYLLIPHNELFSWGFYAHKKINRQAVFSLPPEMMGFYKKHIEEITEKAVAADERRHNDEDEAPRHYIDIDAYGDSAVYEMPRYWYSALEVYPEDTLIEYGIVPWHVNLIRHQLVEAFREKDATKIIRLSADLGHYIADSHVPLHTTLNYNGQLTGQDGIHSFWETRLPELFSDDYNLLVGPASYHENPQLSIWDAVTGAHEALDSVLSFEKELSLEFTEDQKYAFEKKADYTRRIYSKEFSASYHEKLDGQVERQMRKSIKLVADFWYTCWIEAGQPVLDDLD